MSNYEIKLNKAKENLKKLVSHMGKVVNMKDEKPWVYDFARRRIVSDDFEGELMIGRDLEKRMFTSMLYSIRDEELDKRIIKFAEDNKELFVLKKLSIGSYEEMVRQEERAMEKGKKKPRKMSMRI